MIAKIWSSVSKSTTKFKKFIDTFVKKADKLFKLIDDRLYCAFAKKSTYLWVKTLGVMLFAVIEIISSIGNVIQYIIDILDGKWDGYLDTNNINPGVDLTKDY